MILDETLKDGEMRIYNDLQNGWVEEKETMNIKQTPQNIEIYNLIHNQHKEIERLNNIINDAIKLCEENAEAILEIEGDYYYMFEEIRDFLQGKEKEDDK